MKVPKAQKMTSGNWFIRMRLGGENVCITESTEKACIREAQAVKAEYLAGKREVVSAKPDKPNIPSLTQAIDNYISARSAILSPSTIRGYRAIQRHRFPGAMMRRVDEIKDDEWQGILNEELHNGVGPVTVRKAFALIRSVIKDQTGHIIPLQDLTLPDGAPAVRAYLKPDEIQIFVQAVKDTTVAVPALLALSSLRISEITALRCEMIPKDPDFIPVRGAVVRGEDTAWVRRDKNKNKTSTRNVPVLIPELKEAIARDRKPRGPVLSMDQDNLRLGVHKVCQEAGITDVTIHGLRHSFASLAYHLRVPERIAMEIGGWADSATMHKIYTHISQSDITRYQNELAAFYAPNPKKPSKKPSKK